MHDYELERLNTRSFEQLIQALGTEIIGPQLVIFGDGPDGGREATFDGPIAYPRTKRPWNGYGIVQAKFRQQPDSTAKKNADWAIRQLKSEFAKLKPRKKRKKTSRSNSRVCPDYYIFATNLVLSPAEKSGGKDRVRSVCEGFKKSHGLKDYAIWDRDQIRRFLDDYPGIRTTYTAWLLPGDVLAEMMRVLELEKTDFLSTIRRYLESELLDDQFARLGQGGYTDAKTIPLSSVFVDLPVSSPDAGSIQRKTTSSRSDDEIRDEDDPDERALQEGNHRTFLNIFFEEGRQVLRPSATQRQTPLELRARSQDGRLVLIGGPGQGKTTVGQFACQLLRAALLRATGGPFSFEVSQALERIDEMSTGLPRVCARRYPLRVDLKHLAASLAATDADKVKNLFDYLVKRISNRTNSVVRQNDFRRWLGAYPWVLVLDGLDEVPASSNRQQVMQAIRDFISVEAHGANADLLVLATTRPQGYSNEFDPTLYRHLPLAPLDPDQALAYGLRLATARHPRQQTRIEELTASLKRATKNSATLRLMQSPLQVTIMLALIEGGGEPPEQRWKLFHDYYDVIYRREKERATAFSAILSRYEPDIHWIHHRAGWLLQQRNAATGTTDARFTHEEFEEIVGKRLERSGHDEKAERLELAQAIRVAATDRLVLLVGNTEKAIGFEIRSLQEFMAAEHFFDGGEICVQQTLHAIAPYPYWRNVFLFAAGRVFFERQELIDSVIAICGEMNDKPDDLAQQTMLSGSRLALALLKDGAARNQPASIRVLARCAARGLDCCDNEAILAFAELFSAEAEVVWKEELTGRLTSAKAMFPYHNWLLCMQLMDKGKGWARHLMLSHFPWDGGEIRQFLMLSRRFGDGIPEGFWAQFAGHIFSHPVGTALLILRLENVPTALRQRPLEQFAPLFGDRDRAQQTCQLLLANGSSTGISFYIRGKENLLLWAGFQYPQHIFSSAHHEWRVNRAISEFARKPTKANLVEQLRTISDIDPDGTSSSMSWYYPWQIAVCFSARKAGRPWNEIISCVDAGNIGAEGDWTRWEQPSKKGRSLLQLRCAGFNVSDELQGLILRESGWVLSADRTQILRFVDALSDALKKWPEIREQEQLVSLCCFGLYWRGLDEGTATEEVIARFINSCSEEKVPLTTPVVAALVLGPFTARDKCHLLAKAGRCPIQRGWLDQWERTVLQVNKVLNAVVVDLLGCNEWWYVLRALSFLPPLEALQQIPETFLEQLRLKYGDDCSKAASILRLNRLHWQTNESSDIVRDALALEKDYPEHMLRLFDYIDSAGKSGPHLEAFLAELVNQTPPVLEPGLVKRAMDLLVKLVERRPATTELPDPAIRQSGAPMTGMIRS